MPAKLMSAAGGGITLDAASTATDKTITVPAVNGTMLTNKTAGTVLQVVTTSSTTTVSTSSSSVEADTLLTASITPSSSSNKILILVSSMLRASAGSGNCYVYQKVWRGAIGSGSLIQDGYPIIGAQNTDVRGVGNVMMIDSPATTSSVTYRVSIIAPYAGTVYINSTTNPSFITLMEISA